MSQPAPVPSDPASRRRRGRRVVVVVVVLVFLFFFIPLSGLAVLFDVPLALVTGWARFSLDVLPQARVRWDGVLLFAAVIVLLLTVGHRLVAAFAARVNPPRRWRLRDSARALILCAALFAALLGTGGLVRQVGWLVASDEPLTETYWTRLDPYVLRRPRFVCSAIRYPPERLRAPDGRFLLAAIPVGHPTLHAVPLELHPSGTADEVLLFPRDADDLAARGGFLCRPGSARELGSAEVLARLAALRAEPVLPGTGAAPSSGRPR